MPLIVCIHGGTYCAEYFDAQPCHSILEVAKPLGIPIISINRPGYKQTTALPEPSNTGSDTHLQNDGRWLHQVAIPALWNEFGRQSGASTIVLLGHSLGMGVAIIISSLHSQEGSSVYPLAGLAASGLAPTPRIMSMKIDFIPGPPDKPPCRSWPSDVRNAGMLGIDHTPALASEELIAWNSTHNEPAFAAEGRDGAGPDHYQRYWKDYAKEVRVPILVAMSEMDALFEVNEELVEGIAKAFVKSPRREYKTFKYAPHAVELSWYSFAWYTRVCGFAFECAVDAALLMEMERCRGDKPNVKH